jgi:hypothetical protein
MPFLSYHIAKELKEPNLDLDSMLDIEKKLKICKSSS